MCDRIVIAPKGSVLVLKLQEKVEPYPYAELVAISDDMKLKMGIEVVFLQGWDVVAFWEKNND